MRRSWLRFDYILFLTTLALLGFGLTMIYSATSFAAYQSEGLMATPVMRQALVAILGIVFVFVLTVIDYQVFAYHPLAILSPSVRSRQEPEGLGLTLHHEQYSQVEREAESFSPKKTLFLFAEALSNPFYMLGLLFLLAVMLFGKSAGGAQRWLDLRFFDLQVSEVVKLLLIISLARYFSDHEDTMGRFVHVLVTATALAIPAAIIGSQPDLGTALTLVAIWLGMIVMAGVRWRHLLVLTLAGIAALPLVWTRILSEYQRERLLIFLDPSLDPLGAGYNIIQSRISVGAGGLLGRGINSGTQSQLHFLRVQHTDYIFAVLGEELGFVGATIVIALFTILVLQIISIAVRSRDSFGRFFAFGVASMLVFQVFVNIGMNIGLAPVTGIPLPFISYGRSSLLVLLLCVGILESIAWRRKREEIASSAPAQSAVL